MVSFYIFISVNEGLKAIFFIFLLVRYIFLDKRYDIFKTIYYFEFWHE